VNYKNQKADFCPYLDEIELFLWFQHSLEQSEKEEIVAHLGRCFECFERYYELWTFHQILRAEMLKPTSPNVCNLVKEIESA